MNDIHVNFPARKGACIKQWLHKRKNLPLLLWQKFLAVF